MKYDYYQAIMKTLVNMSRGDTTPEWKEFSNNLKNLVDKLDEYNVLDKNGEYKALNSKEEYQEIQTLFDKTLEGYEKYNKLPFNENDPIDKIRHKLADDVRNDFLTPAYVEYQHVDITKNISLREAMENFRSKPIKVTDDEMKQVGGNLSSRTKLTLDFDGQKVDGVFTPTSTFRSNESYTNLLEDIAKRYPRYAEYFRSLNNEEGFAASARISVGDFVTNGAFYQDTLAEFEEQGFVPDASLDLFHQYYREPEFVSAYSEFARKFEPLSISEVVNKMTLQLEDGDNIDKRNSAMSGMAHLLNKDDSLAKSRPITIEREVNGQKVLVEGTFMEFAKGKDPGNLPIKDMMRETPVENYDTPEAKQSMANLQIIDYLCGNVDRHAGNIFYNFDPETKKLVSVQGIDNDASFFKGSVNKDDVLNQWQGLNHLRVIDEETALRVTLLEEGPLKATLQGYGLKNEEIEAAWNRTKELQEAIKQGKLYENENDIKVSAPSDRSYIVIVPQDKWKDVPLEKLALNSSNIFSKVADLAKQFNQPAVEDDKLKRDVVIQENALKTKLNLSSDLLKRAKDNKPIMGTSTRYKNIIKGLEDLDKAKSHDEKIEKLADLKKYVNTYKQEKRADNVLDENGRLIKQLSGKDLGRVELVDDVDKYIDTINAINGELNQTKEARLNNVKKVDEINSTYRRGKYANYAKANLNPEGKIIVDKEIFERDELFNKSMDNLTQTMTSKEALGLRKKDQKLINEAEDYKRVRQNEVNNLKNQLSKEYNQGLIPKEYYDERIEQLNTNNFETSLEYRFAGGVQVNQALQDFRNDLLKEVDEDIVNNNPVANEELENEKVVENNIDDPTMNANN